MRFVVIHYFVVYIEIYLKQNTVSIKPPAYPSRGKDESVGFYKSYLFLGERRVLMSEACQTDKRMRLPAVRVGRPGGRYRCFDLLKLYEYMKANSQNVEI